MLWFVLVAMVGLVAMSVSEQLNRENDAACVRQLAREYVL